MYMCIYIYIYIYPGCQYRNIQTNPRFHGGTGPHRHPGPAILHIRTVPRHHCPWTVWFSNDGPLARDINGVEKCRKACNYDPARRPGERSRRHEKQILTFQVACMQI